METPSSELPKEGMQLDERKHDEEKDKQVMDPDPPSNSEKLEHLDLSFITEKNINNAKRVNKSNKLKEINENVPAIMDKTSTEQVESNTDNKRHIRLMEQLDEFLIQDLVNEVASTEVITKLGYLLDLFPKFRTAFSKALKLTPKSTINNVITLVNKFKIIKVKGKVEGVDCEIFLDTCASVNIITRTALEKFGIHKTPLGSIKETVFQAYSNSSIESEIYELEIAIGKHVFKDQFRVIEKDDLFDILIGVDSLKKNRFDLNLVENSLNYINESNQPTKLTELFYDLKFGAPQKDEENEITSKPVLLTIIVEKEDTNSDKISKKESMIKEIVGSVPKEFQERTHKLFLDNVPTLALKTDDLGKSKLLPHKINLIPNAKPIKQKAYRISKIQAKALKQQLTTLLENKLIEPSHSSWSFPVVLVEKKNKEWRMCVDYRQLNKITIKDSYALPLIDDILSLIGNVRILSTLDLYSGYHQIPMNTEDKEKTAFTTMFGNYNFLVMPFGLCNAPATFQREMNRLFFDLIGVCVFVYIDDLVIFSNSFEQHLLHLEKVFKILAENGLKVNFEKCSFFKEEVELLGHTLSTNGLSPLPSKVKVISNWLPPRTVTQLKSFLGAVGYYRKFIKNFAAIAKPLFNLLKKDTSFSWTEDCDSAFYLLKEKLITAPILSSPDYSKPFIIRTDASRDGLGGVLLQRDDNQVEVPLYYESRTLTKAEQNYSITDLEGKAVFYCVQKFKPFITGNPFVTTVFTDHKPLVSIFSKREPTNNRHLKWVTELSILNVVVAYEEGRRNVIADALSRIPLKGNIESALIAYTDQNLNKLMDEFINNRIIKVEGVDYFKEGDKLRKIVSDRKEQLNLIKKAHEIGHEGLYKTYHRLKRDFYWRNMKRDVNNFIRCCHKCQVARPQPLNQNVESIPTSPGYPFSQVGLDLIGPLPITKRGNRFIIVLVDYLTKWVEADPLPSTESEEVIFFLKKVFARHGIPEILITDNGPQFTSDKTKAFLDLNDVFVHYVSTYHPASNGEVENRNKEISKYLRLLGDRNNNWDEILYSALWALRTCRNEVTKYSSFELLYGRRDLQPFEVSINVEKRNPFESEEEYLLRKFINHDQWIREAISNIETANKLWSDRRNQIKRLRSRFQPGDLVLVKVFNRRKLEPFFTGPLQIVKQELNTVTVCDPITKKVADRNIHLKNVIPYFTEINLNKGNEK